MKKLKRLFVNKSVRRISCLTVASAGFLAASSPAKATTTIISDTFTNSSNYGQKLDGGTDDSTSTNLLPGGTYYSTGSQYDFVKEYTTAGSPAQSGAEKGLGTPYYAGFESNGGVGTTLGSYNTGVLAVTGDILGYNAAYNTFSNDTLDLATAYVGVGFTSLTTPASSYGGPSALSSFTGLVAEGNGALQEYVNGTAVGGAIAYGGTYSSTTAETLSYDLNTATGAITDVSFGSSTATYSFSTSSSFSNSDTVSADILGSGGSPMSAQSTQGQLGSFSIDEAAATPEPSAFALMTGGLVALGALGLRRRNNSV